MPGPAFDPSSQAKTKLKAFQFIEGRPSPRPATNEGNKENEDGAPEDAQQPAQEVLTDKTVETLTVTTVAKGLPPSTPAARLPLADLIGMMEEPANRPMPATSPEERVIWQPGANDSTPNERPTRKRKRARSSSPVSSSQNEASNFFAGNNEAFDLQNLHQSLRTPQADPAADLWSRYGVDTDSKQTPSAVKAVAFAHLIEKSSPHSSATAGSVSGLRRWASCGVEWPSATKPTKRRKTAGTFREGKAATTNDAIEREDARGAKGSKVGRLVEKIQETLAKPNNNSSPQGPSSSSPLPDTRGPEVADCVSPLQRLDPVVEALEAEPSPSAREGSAREVPQAVAPRKSPRSSSSEFGDVDIDMDMIEAVESQHALETNPAAAVEQLDVEETLGNTAAPDLQPAESQHDVGCLDPQAERDNDFDEFEDDGDAFAADLEIVASMYDTRPIIAEPTQDEARLGAPVAAAAQVPRGEHRSTANDTPPANVASFVDLDSDDDFGGDDIDVEQFVAAEAVATQHLQDTVASQAQVGRSQL